MRKKQVLLGHSLGKACYFSTFIKLDSTSVECLALATQENAETPIVD